MRKIIIFLIFVFCTIFSYSQERENQKIEPIGDLFEVTIYYDDGNIMQHGFLTKDNKLHASWDSYYPNGNRKSVAFYDHGEKVGTWYYWFMDKKTKVVYNHNKIVKVEELSIE